MSDAIERVGPVALTPSSFEEAKSFASSLAKANGFVPRAYIGQPAAVLAAIVMGAEIGIGPMQSLRSIHVIEGKPQLSADLMLALAIRAGVRVQWLQSDDKAARCKLTRDGFPDHTHGFTIAEAKAAGLAGRGNWSKYTASMLRARCISHALRAWSPDVLGAGVYVEGEIEEARAVERQPEPPVAAVEPEPQASGEQVPEADVVDAEQACAEQETPSGEVKLKGTDTRTMGELQTADDVQTWLASGWDGRIAQSHRAGKRGLEMLLAHADKIGVGHEDVRRWCGIGEEAA